MAWTKKSDGVILTPYLANEITKLSQAVDFDFVVTSGVRDPKQQALAMFSKIQAGDVTLSDYRNREFAQSIIEAYPNIEAATNAVIEAAKKGIASYHLVGRAFDVRSWSLDISEQRKLRKVFSELIPDGSSIIETQPPHIHFTLPPEKKNQWWILLALGAMWISRA